MIIDAGGGTVDISTYAFKSVEPVKVEEISVPSCKYHERSGLLPRRAHRLPGLLEGSVIVRHRAEALIRGTLHTFSLHSLI